MSSSLVLERPSRTVPAPVAPAAPALQLTSGQWIWLGFQSVILAALTVWSALTDPYFSLLWQDVLGIKMLLQAGLLLAANFAMLVLGCAFLNRFLGRQNSLACCLLSACLYGACFIFFYLPILWVVRLAPAAIQITRALAGF